MRKKTRHDDKKKKFLSSGGESVLKGSSSEKPDGDQDSSQEVKQVINQSTDKLELQSSLITGDQNHQDWVWV